MIHRNVVIFFIFILAACLFVQGAYSEHQERYTASSRDHVVVDPRILRMIRDGPVRVLIRLRLPRDSHKFEDQTAGDPLTLKQKTIQSIQIDILDKLKGMKFNLYRRYKTSPYMALEVYPGALVVLQTLGNLISAIQLDELSAPSQEK